MNVIASWLSLIGTPERARKLRARLDGLKSPPLDPLFGPEPPLCPTVILYGTKQSQKLYVSNEANRRALDRWDTGYVTKSDLRRYCQAIESGLIPVVSA